MSQDDILILGAREVEAALQGREEEVMDAVGKAYMAHAKGESSLPHSSFLRFPDSDKDRIISLPAYLGESFQLAGLKWIASVPANVQKGIERASAVVILNERETGRPTAILEGSLISKQRTAASAALAARVLREGRQPEAIGLVGCGPISFAMAHFLSAVWPEVTDFMAFDLDKARAEEFGARLQAERSGASFSVAPSLREMMAECPLVAFGTTAIHPHVDDISDSAPGATLLHISLRDLVPEIILENHNVVDDMDHVCRANTSIHLASEVAGNRDFVHSSLGDILLGNAELPAQDGRRVIFTPFGLGVLDLAVADLVHSVAVERGEGTLIKSFLP